jgi:hypothetical protein
MTLVFRMRHVCRVGFAVGLAALLLAAPVDGAGDDPCLGSWRFDLAAPEPAKEAWLSHDSWCRASRLPRTLVVEVRRGQDGRAIMTGTPLQPADVLAGHGKCDFRFSGSSRGLPQNHELAIEVDDAAGIVHGTGRCSQLRPEPDGTRSGATIEVAVTGSRSANANAPRPAVDQPAAAIIAACRQSDAKALWQLLTPRFRAELDRHAARVRRSVPAGDLETLYGHRGRPETFTGLAFLSHAVHTPGSPDNPCAGVEHWELGPGTATADGYVQAVHRSDGFAFSLKLTRGGRGWLLDQITKSVSTH